MMIVAKLVVAGFTISYKLAAPHGINMSILITYRYLVASVLILPFALFLERNERPKITWVIFFQAFACAFFGGPFAQKIYTLSLVSTPTTFVAAISNLIPPFTFIIAVLLRLEKVEMHKISGKAKVIGTLVGVGGATMLTFYKGHRVNFRSTHFDFLSGHPASTVRTTSHAHLLGSLLAFAYSISIAVCYIFQSKLSDSYPCHYSSTLLYSVIGFMQAFVYAVATERSLNQWKLDSTIKQLSVIFQGVSSLVAVVLVMAVVRLRGPFFVSSFNPLVLVFVMIAGFVLLDEHLYVGSLVGSTIIIAGLYLVLFGKGKEDEKDASNVIATTTPEIEIVYDACASSEEDEMAENSSRENQQELEIIEEV